jgi:acetoin utilization deacetylase AcuC-like enzyme
MSRGHKMAWEIANILPYGIVSLVAQGDRIRAGLVLISAGFDAAVGYDVREYHVTTEGFWLAD